MEIASWFARVGIKVDENQWKSADNKIKTFTKDFKSIKLAVVAAAGAFLFLEKKIGNMAGALTNQSQILQTPTKNLQALQLAAKQSFVPVNDAIGAVGNLQTALANFRTGQGLPENLQMGLGMLSRASGEVVNPSNAKTGYELFERIAQALSKVQNVQLKEGILNKLFGNSNLLPLIGNGLNNINKAYAELQKNNGFFSPSQLNTAKEYAQQMSLLGASLKKLGVSLGVEILPVLEKINKMLLVMAKNSAKAVEPLEGLKEIITDIFKAAKYPFVKIDQALWDFGKKDQLERMKHFGNKSINNSTVNNSTVNNTKNNSTTIINHPGFSMLTSQITGGMA